MYARFIGLSLCLGFLAPALALSLGRNGDTRGVATDLVRTHFATRATAPTPRYEHLREASERRFWQEQAPEEYPRLLREAKSDFDKGEYTFREETVIQYYFPYEAWGRVLKKGVLNQHQAGTRLSGGTRNPELRAEKEDRRLGMKLEDPYNPRHDNPVHYIRPKSTILDVSSHPRYRGQFWHSAFHYGEIILIAKDRVKDRSTWSAGDSLEPKRTTTLHASPSHSFDAPQIDRLDPKEYFEAQIWGEFDLRDVQEIWVPDNLSAKKIAEIARAGLPVYTYRVSIDPKKQMKYPRRAKQPISAGTPELQALLDQPPTGLWEDFIKVSGYERLVAKSALECGLLARRKGE